VFVVFFNPSFNAEFRMFQRVADQARCGLSSSAAMSTALCRTRVVSPQAP
jgi:hypothetical protein